MPKFSDRSQRELNTCHPALQRVFAEVIKHYDCTILEGHRNEADQNKMFDTGRSKLRWPDGKHNSEPSEAVDAAPYPVDWRDRERFLHFTGFVLGVATAMGVTLRLGIDWNGDHEFNEDFNDSPHFELVFHED